MIKRKDNKMPKCGVGKWKEQREAFFVLHKNEWKLNDWDEGEERTKGTNDRIAGKK